MTSQLTATSHGRLVRSLQDDAALGVYRVRLDNIDIPVIARNRIKNVTRLKKVFLAQRCLRHEPRNYIQATIQQDVLEHRSSIAQSSDGLNELLLRAEDSVYCKHGSCRIKAAKAVLRGQDRWWTVALYKENIGKTLAWTKSWRAKTPLRSKSKHLHP